MRIKRGRRELAEHAHLDPRVVPAVGRDLLASVFDRDAGGALWIVGVGGNLDDAPEAARLGTCRIERAAQVRRVAGLNDMRLGRIAGEDRLAHRHDRIWTGPELIQKPHDIFRVQARGPRHAQGERHHPSGGVRAHALDTPTAILVRQVLGAIAEFEKTILVAKLAAARKRKRVATGEKVEGRKSHAELRPDVVKLAKALARKKPKGGRLSLRSISAELAAQGYLNERGRPFNPKSVAAMLASDRTGARRPGRG